MENEAEETRLYDSKEKKSDYTKIRVPQLPGNARVIAPAPLNGANRDTELHHATPEN